jgi:hypothetical protein
MCFLPPAKNSNCAAAQDAAKSYVVLGSGKLPKVVMKAGGLTSLNSVPLRNTTNNTSVSASDQHAIKFESNPLSVAIPAFGSSKPTQIKTTTNMIVLWDSGAASQSSVPTPVYQAALAYYNQSLVVVNK